MDHFLNVLETSATINFSNLAFLTLKLYEIAWIRKVQWKTNKFVIRRPTMTKQMVHDHKVSSGINDSLIQLYNKLVTNRYRNSPRSYPVKWNYITSSKLSPHNILIAGNIYLTCHNSEPQRLCVPCQVAPEMMALTWKLTDAEQDLCASKAIICTKLMSQT